MQYLLVLSGGPITNFQFWRKLQLTGQKSTEANATAVSLMALRSLGEC